jgi:hypothetical protein
MILLKRCLFSFLVGISVFWGSALIADDQTKTITEIDCARLQDSEIIWHLSEYRWLCCIPKNQEEYETCLPITDMKPPPKTSLKPFPQETTRTIEPENKKK